MHVQIIEAPNEEVCKCGSLLIHWMKFAGDQPLPPSCPAKGCTKPVEFGTYVKTNAPEKMPGQWIIPLCKVHGTGNEEWFQVESHLRFVSSDLICQYPFTPR